MCLCNGQRCFFVVALVFVSLYYYTFVILDINPSTTCVTEMGTVFIESEIKTNLCIIGLWRQHDVDSAVNLLITSIEYLNDII